MGKKNNCVSLAALYLVLNDCSCVLPQLNFPTTLRSCLLSQVPQIGDEPPSPDQLKAFGTVISIGSSRASRVSVLGVGIMSSLPLPVRNVIEKWNAAGAGNEFPSIGSWVSPLVLLILHQDIIERF